MTAPAPGWYPNPDGPGQRYFDGRQWTTHQIQQPVPPPVTMEVKGPNHHHEATGEWPGRNAHKA